MTVHNFLSEDECDKQVSSIDRLIDGGFCHEIRSASARKDSSVYMSFVDLNARDGVEEIAERLRGPALSQYISKFPILEETLIGMHEIKAQRTPPGGGFHNWHYEHDQGWHGNRVLTWIIYLNDDYEAGETEFLYQQVRVKPKKGMLAMFPCSFLHTHRGNPPHGKNKYIMTGWMVDLDPFLARYNYKG